jgi:hypothetical protein
MYDLISQNIADIEPVAAAAGSQETSIEASIVRDDELLDAYSDAVTRAAD